MRYTTIIDLREWPQAYKSVGVRLLYLHFCLVAGYHAEDRDKCLHSFRQLAHDTGMTLSAARHAVKQLEKLGLLKREGEKWVVTKFVMPKEIPSRPRSTKATNGYSDEVYKIIHHEFSYDEKKALENDFKTQFMWVFEQVWRLHSSGDTTGEKYLKANWNQYQAERQRQLAMKNPKGNE